MKKLYYLMAISCMFLSLPLTSCDDDDDDEVIEEATSNTTDDTTSDETTTDETVVEEYIGEEFTGTLAVTVGGEVQEPIEQSVYVLENGDGTITLNIKDFEFYNISFGDIVVENCVVDGTSFSGSASLVYMEFITIDLDLEGTFDGENLEFSSSFSIEILGLDIEFTFSTGDIATNEGDTDEGDEEADDEADYTITGTASEYTGTLTASVYGYEIPFSDVVISVGENEEGETVIACDKEIDVESIATISSLYINCGTIAENGTFEGTVTVNYSVLGGSPTEETPSITGTITTDDDNNITIEASFKIMTIISLDVKFTTVASE